MLHRRCAVPLLCEPSFALACAGMVALKGAARPASPPVRSKLAVHAKHASSCAAVSKGPGGTAETSSPGG
jgi:hypothetical protein